MKIRSLFVYSYKQMNIESDGNMIVLATDVLLQQCTSYLPLVLP